MNSERVLDGFEALETRLLLAGDVTGVVVGDTLVLEGDGRDNWFEVNQFGPSSFLVVGLASPGSGTTGSSPTTINGKTVDDFSGVKNFRVALNNGNDFIHFNGAAGAAFPGGSGTMTIPGRVAVRGNNGTDNILYTDVLIKGVNNSFGNDGGDTIQHIDSVLKSKVTIDGGNQGDTIATIRSTYNSPTTIKGGTGPDRIFMGLSEGGLEGATFKDTLRVFLGSNRNFLESTESTFLGTTIFRGGDQKDDVDINDSVFRGRTTISTGGGKDLVEINDSLFRSSALNLFTGAEIDRTRVFDTRFDTDKTVFSGGSGNDNFAFNDSFFTGSAEGRSFRGSSGLLDRLDAGIFTADNGNVFIGGTGFVGGWEKAT